LEGTQLEKTKCNTVKGQGAASSAGCIRFRIWTSDGFLYKRY